WSHVSAGVDLYNLGPVTIGDHTVLSQRVFVCAGTHDYTRAELPLLRPPIRIGHGVWIAAEAFVAPDVTIGDNAVVAARAVVTRDVPPRHRRRRQPGASDQAAGDVFGQAALARGPADFLSSVLGGAEG